MKRYLLLMTLFGLSVGSFAQNGKARRSDGTECAALPCVVASVSLTDQSLRLSQVPLYAPTSDGLFRISAYMTTSNGTRQNAFWAAQFGWTDALAARMEQALALNPNGAQGVEIVAQDIAGQPLTYSTNPHGGGGGVGGMTYNLLITVEQLQ